MVRRLEQMGELSKGTVFIDGTKLEACANKYTFVWKKSVGKWEEQHTVFVHGKGRRKSRNQRYLELFRRFLECQTVYDWHTASFQDRNDVWTLVPFLETMEKKVGFRYPSVTADSGYESEEAYTYLREQKQKPYIKPQTYEKWKKRSFKQDISKRENMGYDKITDTYICHAGKELKPLFIKNRKVRVAMNQK